MTTTKTRINISISDDVSCVLSHLAKRDQVPTATMASSLLRYALERKEDVALDAIATQREKDGGKFISHEEAWA